MCHLSHERKVVDKHLMSTYTDCTQSVPSCDQLFVCFANPARYKALSKQQRSYWIVEAPWLIAAQVFLCLTV